MAVVSLEERVDERRDSGALRQDQQQSENAEGNKDRRHPPALIAPEKGKQFAGDSEPVSSGLQETHTSSPTSFTARFFAVAVAPFLGTLRHTRPAGTIGRFPRRAIPQSS